MKVRHMAAVNNSGGGIREQSETGEAKKASEMLRKGGKYKRKIQGWGSDFVCLLMSSRG